MGTMRVELTGGEAQVAARCLLALNMITSQASQQTARVNAKIAELETEIRKRVPDLPDVAIGAWNWAGLDLLEGTGTVEIPEPPQPERPPNREERRRAERGGGG